MMYRVLRCNIGFVILCFCSIVSLGQQDFVSKQSTQTGFNLHVDALRKLAFLELADSLIDRDFLVLSRIIECSPDFPKNELRQSGIRGATTSEQIIRIAKKEEGIVQMNALGYDRHINAHPQLESEKAGWVLGIYSYRKLDHDKILIDVSSLIFSDADIFFSGYSKRSLLSSKVDPPDIKINYTYCSSGIIDIGSSRMYKNESHINLNTSFYLLPLQAMVPRYADKRVNYFSLFSKEYKNGAYVSTPHEVILRWNLKPKKEDENKYLMGELVVPQKPIIFYLDTTIPKKWVPYFIAAVNDWQPVFEQVGFKNAIQGKELPILDKDASSNLFNFGYSVIHYIESGIRDATYSTVSDPRTGEILQSHILWSKGCEINQREMYFAQASPSDLRARTLHFPDELMGELIRRVVAHEIGHALGFEHNQIASYSVPTSKIRKKSWVEENGYTPSIMDYARYNYIAQPEDNIKKDKGLMYAIGEYDAFALNYGYRYFGDRNDAYSQDSALLFSWVTKKQQSPKYRYSHGSEHDPRTSDESLGHNIIVSSALGIKNLQFIMKHFAEWIDIRDSSRTLSLYFKMIEQFNLYKNHAVAFIAGVYEPTCLGSKAVEVSQKKQLKAVRFLKQHYFGNIDWLFPGAIPYLQKQKSIVQNIIYAELKEQLFSEKAINRLNNSKYLKVKELVTDLKKYLK